MLRDLDASQMFFKLKLAWIPACAGMTLVGIVAHGAHPATTVMPAKAGTHDKHPNVRCVQDAEGSRRATNFLSAETCVGPGLRRDDVSGMLRLGVSMIEVCHFS
jgi:hypothetical protein